MLRLKVRSFDLEDAKAAYSKGALADVTSVLFDVRDIEATILCARAFNRMGRPRAALEHLGPPLIDGPVAQVVQRELVRASSLISLGMLDDAQATLNFVSPYVTSAASCAADAEFAVVEGHYFFACRNLDSAAESARRALSGGAYRYASPGYFPVEATSSALAMNLLGMVAASNERYVEQMAHVRSAIGIIQESGHRDDFLLGWLLTNAAFLVRDLDFESDAQFLRSQAASLEANQEVQTAAFHVRRSLAWHFALRGDHLSAFRDFRAAGRMATSNPLKISAALDRAFLAREIGERSLAKEELSYAERLSDAIDWNQTSHDERLALMHLAEGLSHFSAPKARRALDRFLSLKAKLSPLLFSSFDRRGRAFECYAHGNVLVAEGQSSRAIPMLLEAFKTFSDVGYRWRAALVALQLARLTEKKIFGDYVRAEAGARPNSWLSRAAQTV